MNIIVWLVVVGFTGWLASLFVGTDLGARGFVTAGKPLPARAPIPRRPTERPGQYR